MGDNFNFLVALAALLSSGLAIVAVWRKAGAIEGKVLERLDTHQTWLTGHEKRIQDLEGEPYLTPEEHDRLCGRQVLSLEKQSAVTDSGLKDMTVTLKEMERERSRAREIDNQRWTKIETTLGAVLEYIESEKRRGH